MKHIRILPLLLVCTAPAAFAQEEEKEQEPIQTGWFEKDDGMSVHHSGIILPQKIAHLEIAKNEQPKSGKNGLDNIIQYVSGDSDVFASIYVYRPSFADAELTAHMTAKAINIRYGIASSPEINKLSNLAGIPNSSIVMGYEKTAKGSSTAAAFAKVGPWIIKIRVSGPESDFDQVMQVMDASIANIKLDSGVKAETLSLSQPKPCTVELKGSAKAVKLSKEDNTANALMTGLLGSLIGSNTNSDEGSDAEDSITKRVSFNQWCVAENFEISGSKYNVFRSEDKKSSDIMFPFSDAGHIFITTNNLLDDTRNLSLFEIGLISNYGGIHGDLSSKQYREILTGKSKLKLQKKSQNTMQADGNTSINIFTL